VTLQSKTWIGAAALVLLLGGCGKKSSKAELPDKLLGNARPELRKAITALSTPTPQLDAGGELQVALRLHLVVNEMKFRPMAEDRPILKSLVTNKAASAYSRICAAYFLLDSDADARALLTNYVASSNLRHRYNAARAIQWFAFDAQGEAHEWATLELIKMVENRCLETPSNTETPSRGYEVGYDLMDDHYTPLDYVIDTLGELKERRAIPALMSLIERHRWQSSSAVSALGEIGDPSVAPFLLKNFVDRDSLGCGHALALLRYRPAVPLLLDHLNHSETAYGQERVLDDLLEMGDASALPDIEKFAQSPREQGARKAAARVIAQMRDKDPVASLLAMLDKEQGDERVDLIRDLGRYPDQRAIDRLFALAVSFDDTLIRGNAIRTLGRMGDQRALLALVAVMETNAPPPVKFDMVAMLDGSRPDYSKVEAARALHEATRRNLGEDPKTWRRWIVENR
jgi:HEAT repeat protein